MDYTEAASNAIIQINRAEGHPELRPDMVSAVCSLFDIAKGRELTRADKLFLHNLANKAGLPHYYYPMLGIGEDVDDIITLQTLSNFVKESALVVGENVSLHLYQKEILNLFSNVQPNRFFLSASTSFGKTFLIYEIIRKMQYNNIILIFPTIALMSENLEKINTDSRYSWVKERYRVHTLSDIAEWGEHNIFIYTPERYLSFMDKNPNRPRIDFVFVDEAYKLDNSFVIDDEEQENERDITYRVALYYLLQQLDIDCLLAAPYVENLNSIQNRQNDSFGMFLTLQNISVLDYNRYEIVGKKVYNVYGRKIVNVSDEYQLHFPESSKQKRLVYTVSQLIARKEQMIVYAYSRTSAESYARKLIESSELADIDTRSFDNFLIHLGNSMSGNGVNWVVTRALKKGIGIHHGLVPKYIQNEIIKLFNEGILHTLICTTTITEGVNTTAKNMIILSNMKGTKTLKKFDAKNIEGRAGRFLKHYQGRVFVLDSRFNDIMQLPDEVMHHKFYDPAARKNDVDLMFINDRQFLNSRDLQRKSEIEEMLSEHPLHPLIQNSFSTISVEDKITLYLALTNLDQRTSSYIQTFVNQYYDSRFYGTQNFNEICKQIRPIVNNNEFAFLLDKDVNGVCLFAILVYYYLRQGLNGCIVYRLNTKNIDTAVQESAKFVYNTLKYQAVKYLGLFNLIYKVVQTERTGVAIEDVHGIDALLAKFEFNANTTQGRMVSDLGAPQRVIEYFDCLVHSKRSAQRKHAEMDAYEKLLTRSIAKIINENE